MIQLIVKRLGIAILTLWVVLTLTFLLLRGLPGGPFDSERRLPPAIQKNIEAQYHLNQPVWVQYGYYLNDLIHGDFGPSYKFQSRTVNELVWPAFQTSFLLGLFALLLGIPTGAMLGLWAGITRWRWWDQTLATLGMACLSLPSFVFGGVMVLLFALQWHWLPAARLTTPAHWVLPVITLSIVPFAYSFLLIRNQVKEVRQAQYVHIKQTYGLTAPVIFWAHIFRNSLAPLVSILGPLAAALITGSFAVEFIYALPGMGKQFIFAVSNRDYPLVIGLTLIYSVVLLVLNLLTDLLQAALNPKLRDAMAKGVSA